MLKLMLETEHLQCLVLEFFLLMFFQASLIQLKFVEHLCESKSLMPSWRSANKWFER